MCDNLDVYDWTWGLVVWGGRVHILPQVPQFLEGLRPRMAEMAEHAKEEPVFNLPSPLAFILITIGSDMLTP